MEWSPPALVVEQLRVRPGYRTCYYCDAELALSDADVVIAPWGSVYVRPGLALPTTDHKLPTSRGGTDALDNLVLACVSCNSRKRDKTADEYLDYLSDRGDFKDATAARMLFGSAAFFDRALREAGVA